MFLRVAKDAFDAYVQRCELTVNFLNERIKLNDGDPVKMR